MKILVVEDEKTSRDAILFSISNPRFRELFEGEAEVIGVGSFGEAKLALGKDLFDLALLDIRLGDGHPTGGIELLKTIRTDHPTTVPIMMSSIEDYETVERCLFFGAADYLFKPFEPGNLYRYIRKAQAAHKRYVKHQSLKAQAGDRAVSQIELKTKSPSFQKVLDQAKKLQGTNLSVLILGETGVGKEVMAQYLWSLEGDESRPFIPMHSVAINADLFESTLFGHVKGSFTGATQNKMGMFQAAHRGDFFLDEIATIPPVVQQKLLRVLQEKKVTPVGSNEAISVDCRVICATNENLDRLMKIGQFREDLYYRIKRAVLFIPPLRERKEDIPDLVESLLLRSSGGTKRLSASALKYCLEYHWPGNVRELEGILDVLAQMAEGSEITREDLETQIRLQGQFETLDQDSSRSPNRDHPFGLNEDVVRRNYKHLLQQFEKTMFEIALKKTGSENGAAQYLGLPRSTLGSKRKLWGV